MATFNKRFLNLIQGNFVDGTLHKLKLFAVLDKFNERTLSVIGIRKQ